MNREYHKAKPITVPIKLPKPNPSNVSPPVVTVSTSKLPSMAILMKCSRMALGEPNKNALSLALPVAISHAVMRSASRATCQNTISNRSELIPEFFIRFLKRWYKSVMIPPDLQLTPDQSHQVRELGRAPGGHHVGAINTKIDRVHVANARGAMR